jgi:hypothetical protein
MDESRRALAAGARLLYAPCCVPLKTMALECARAEPVPTHGLTMTE